jgi:hypothetical protein
MVEKLENRLSPEDRREFCSLASGEFHGRPASPAQSREGRRQTIPFASHLAVRRGHPFSPWIAEHAD